MHELSIALSLLDLVEEEAARRGCRVVAVHLRARPPLRRGPVGGGLSSAYVLAREGDGDGRRRAGGGGGPRRRLSAAVRRRARPRFLPTSLLCPDCGTSTPDVRSGREMDVVALEIAP